MDNINRLEKEAATKYLAEFVINEQDLDETTQILNVKFSDEFSTSYKIFPYDLFSNFSFLSFPKGVIEETKRLRKCCSLPHDTLFLYEDDASVLLMKCLGDREEIYWIAVEDFENFCEEKPLLYEPTIFLTFPDLFEYLAKEEEKMSASGNKQ